MIPSDRPVIAEPVPRPPTSQPLRVPLGKVMHLNGAIPRGVPLQGAVPRRCKGCAGLFIVFGKGSARAAYCQVCREKKCPSCNGCGGKHYLYCSQVKPRPCRGCDVELGHGGSHSPYCEACRAQRCPECRAYAGRHGPGCLYERRRRRPGLTERCEVVTEQDIVALYLEHRAHAIRIARRIVGAEAEDVVQDVALYLVEKRDYLRDPPGEAYFLTAVKNSAPAVRLEPVRRGAGPRGPDHRRADDGPRRDGRQPGTATGPRCDVRATVGELMGSTLRLYAKRAFRSSNVHRGTGDTKGQALASGPSEVTKP
jgi:Sigma-70 region 2